MRYWVAVLVVFLAGCSSFKVGTVVYLPHGQETDLTLSVKK